MNRCVDTWIGWVIVLLVSGGCASSGANRPEGPDGGDEKATSPPKQRIEADPMLVQVGEDGEGRTIDAGELFDKAYRAFQNRRFERAAERYRAIVEHFPDSRYYRSALYNAGLAYEEIGRRKAASKMYRRLIDEFPDRKDTVDAFYRLADVHARRSDYRAVVELMTKVMIRDDLTTFDRIEARVRRAEAFLEMGRLDKAETGFEKVLELNRKASAADELPENSRFICRAYVGLGRVVHRRVGEIPLKLPPERMGDDLKKKAELLLDAQSFYMRALRKHHPKWSVAAGYRIGRLYEDFYSDIMAAEIPAELTDQQVEMYFDQLRERLRPVLKRAIDVYERNLSMSRRFGETPENNRWVAETAESLERMKRYLRDPQTRERAQKLARQGQDFRQLWRPFERARDAVDRAFRRAIERAADRVGRPAERLSER
ncbi:MAG: tetratricopeptide repeat protein [Bradymonadaceae bacterium]